MRDYFRNLRQLPAWIARGLVLAACACGCDASRPPARVEGEAVPKASGANDSAQAPTDLAAAPRETWDILTLEGRPFGHVHTVERRVEIDGQSLVQIDIEYHMGLRRFQQATEMSGSMRSVETPEGAMLSFESQDNSAGEPKLTTGRVEGETLVLETTIGGRATTDTIAWRPGDGGLLANEQSLRASPMRPGEEREVRGFSPQVNAVTTFAMRAADFEQARVGDRSRRLLRIDCQIRLADDKPALASRLWTDERGEVIRHDQEGGLSSHRATREEALASRDSSVVDIGLLSKVPLARPLANPHATRRIRYLVTTEGQDASQIFPSCSNQSVRRVGANTAEVTVRAVRPNAGGVNMAGPATAEEAAHADRQPTDADLAPSALIQSDDPRVVELSLRGAAAEETEWQTALRLEKTVFDSIANKNFSRAFASAAEVAQTLEGDCTEHAVLLAAMARAAGLPARVAIGLVYMAPDAAFGFHMWTEVFVDGQWTPIDGTLGGGGIGAAHIKVTDTDLAGPEAYAEFLPVAQLLGRLKIEAEEIDGP